MNVGVHMENSGNIILGYNVIADHVKHGIWAQTVDSLIVSTNWVFHIIPDSDETPVMFEYTGWTGGITVSESVTNAVIDNNVVAGTWHHGFHFIPQICNDTNATYIFAANVAHSISGYGAIALNVNNSCSYVEGFTAYKVTEASVMLGGPSAINKGIDIVSIDTRYGPAILPS